ncbi:saccharopine dehydrogenase family protein [Rhodococcus sp. O3]|uniref:saccharopine dehydrogenase family protein n=1 Tax=Rhodococcus sp. O3 TaxID=3404919 RepID=UPI003B671144
MFDNPSRSASRPILHGNCRVVVVGGGGAMGRWAVRMAAGFAFVKDLVVADLDAQRAQEICDEVGGPARPEQLDVTDQVRLRQVFADCDIVLNTVGPFAVFGDRILRTAIDCGCDYLDIDDDWESTLAALESAAAARKAGVRVVKGMGASPGVSNLLAAAAGAELDEVDELYTGWKISGTKIEARDASTGPSAAFAHWLLQSSGTIRTWENGAWADPAPLARIDLDFPGFGRHSVYTCGHPEPVTLARSLPIRRTALNVMSGPDWMFRSLRTVAGRHTSGSTSLAEAATELDKARGPDASTARDPLPPVWALATGSVSGRKQTIMTYLNGRLPGMMGGSTGIPLAVGLQMLADGEIGAPGVLYPETAFEPALFFDRLGKSMDRCPGDDRPLLSILRSEEVF